MVKGRSGIATERSVSTVRSVIRLRSAVLELSESKEGGYGGEGKVWSREGQLMRQ